MCCGSESAEHGLDNMFPCGRFWKNMEINVRCESLAIVNWFLTVHWPYKFTGTSLSTVFTINLCHSICGASDIPLQCKAFWKSLVLKRGETQVTKRLRFSCLSCIEGAYNCSRWTQKGLGLQQPRWHQPTTNANQGVVTLGRCHETESASPQ